MRPTTANSAASLSKPPNTPNSAFAPGRATTPPKIEEGSREWGMGSGEEERVVKAHVLTHSPLPTPHSPFPAAADHFLAKKNILPSLIVKPNSRRAS